MPNIGEGFRELSLFSGVGGGLLGSLLLGFVPIGYVEWDEYCQRVIAQRIKDGILPAAPIFTDVRKFVQSGAAEQYRGVADVVTGGFPCQPFSVAGKRKGADDERNMWPATLDIIRIIRPRFAFLENVPGLFATGYFHTILADLAALGMDARWGVVSAASVGAPHRRERLWIAAYPKSQQDRRLQQRGIQSDTGAGGEVSDTSSNRREKHNKNKRTIPEFDENGDAVCDTECSGLTGDAWRWTGQESTNGRWWTTEPQLGRLANGVPRRVDRLRAIGNGQVPLVAAAAWRLLTGQST